VLYLLFDLTFKFK